MNESENGTGSSTTNAASGVLPAATSNDDRTWALIGHLSAFSAFITGIGCVIGPLIVWLVKRDTMPFVADQGKEALNFNITVTIAAIISGILTLVLIGFLLLAVVVVGWLVLTIMATIESNKGVAYRYPFTLRLIK